MNFNPADKTIKTSIMNPDYTSRSVIADNPWDFVRMFINKNIKYEQKRKEEILHYWNQSKEFYNSGRSLSNYSSPLLYYYSFLNATKAFLKYKNFHFNNYHGLTGSKTNTNWILKNLISKCKEEGVFISFCKEIEGDSFTAAKFGEQNLKNILYNIVFVHRAYCLTFGSDSELFIPISSPAFKFTDSGNSAENLVLSFKIKDNRYIELESTHQYLKKIFNIKVNDGSEVSEMKLELPVREEGYQTDSNSKLELLKIGHNQHRKKFHSINGDKIYWYIKRGDLTRNIDLTDSVLSFAAMHRLSELARYQPMALAHLFDSVESNWILNEFVNISPKQFIIKISSEITGMDFVPPGIRGYS